MYDKDKKKQYYQDNKERILEKKNQYHKDNREQLLEKWKFKIECPTCKCFIRKRIIQDIKKVKNIYAILQTKSFLIIFYIYC